VEVIKNNTMNLRQISMSLQVLAFAGMFVAAFLGDAIITGACGIALLYLIIDEKW